MCGIVGYTGIKDCKSILMDGLEKLAYRGYDSAGIAVYSGGEIVLRKAEGKLEELKKVLKQTPVESAFTGIGHTRWATHGEPSYVNSHPHTAAKNEIALVHNGIIENYYNLREKLVLKGHVFTSQTDTEVIAQLLDYYYEGDMLHAIDSVLGAIEGSFAVAILCKNEPDTIYCICKDSPLVIGHDGHAGYIASDVPALLEHTRDVYFMDNYQTAKVTPLGIAFYDRMGNAAEKQITHIEWDVEAAKKGNYAHFMLKEIFEQPDVLKKTLDQYIDRSKGEIKQHMMPFTKEEANALACIRAIGCGTAYHAGIICKYVIEKLVRIPVDVDIASEFRYRDPMIRAGETFLLISQSGETADTIASLQLAKSKQGKTLAICNTVGSKIARESDFVLYTYAGPEIAVASTKAYLTQIAVVYVLAFDIAYKRGRITKQELQKQIEALYEKPDQIRHILSDVKAIQYFASREFDSKHVFFIGRGLDYALAMEAALKLKEISYIHSEAYAAGELKHGTIALIEEGSLVVAIATQPELYDKMASNMEELRVRGAHVLALTGEDEEVIRVHCDRLWKLPHTLGLLAPLTSIVPMQLFAYYMAVQKGRDVDRPRNLAKSVTVE
ncbi:MAG: glutamine--fructose-6-phosphate transaminase (isomerizing) [Christensenellales bacterium]|jgi:glucosamine--fructose-6-phosphate aminotransferase (isomerizing)